MCLTFPQERGRERERRGQRNPLELGAACKRRKDIGRVMMTVELCGVVVELVVELVRWVPVVLLPWG